tara:strand:+ start:8246 stop:8830 length:585 start_codon:yes stop_codon:yes gene_type:complete
MGLVLYITFGILVVSGLIFYENKTNDLIKIMSSYDGREYLVRNLSNGGDAADILATIREKLVTLCEYLSIKDNSERTTRLISKFNPDNIKEVKGGSKYTSYSINKGEQIVFCLRSRDGTDKLIDINTVMFVALHELSHIMTKSIGHTPEFWKNFKYLLKIAVSLDLYKEVDYSINPQKYCGMTVTDTPLTDESI